MNKAFRAYVTRTRFNLSLGKTHIDLLLEMQSAAEQKRYHRFLVDHRGLTGLLERGLIEQAVLKKDIVWKLTRAGELVAELLDEAYIVVGPHEAVAVGDLEVIEPDDLEEITPARAADYEPAGQR